MLWTTKLACMQLVLYLGYLQPQFLLTEQRIHYKYIDNFCVNLILNLIPYGGTNVSWQCHKYIDTFIYAFFAPYFILIACFLLPLIFLHVLVHFFKPFLPLIFLRVL
jgi:hypothetical protein